MSIITPEEENALEPTHGSVIGSVDRLCEYNTELQEGCRRTQTMLNLEEAYGINIHPEMEWGYWDLFCIIDNNIYIDKSWLQFNVDDDATPENNNNSIETELQFIESNSGSDWLVTDMDKIAAVVDSENQCLPIFIDQNEQFYRFKSPGTTLVTNESITREMLDAIQESFRYEDINPLLSDLEGSIYVQGNVATCPNLLAYSHNPLGKYGVMIGTSYYPFSELTSDEETFVTKLVYLEHQQEVDIINL